MTGIWNAPGASLHLQTTHSDVCTMRGFGIYFPPPVPPPPPFYRKYLSCTWLTILERQNEPRTREQRARGVEVRMLVQMHRLAADLTSEPWSISNNESLPLGGSRVRQVTYYWIHLFFLSGWKNPIAADHKRHLLASYLTSNSSYTQQHSHRWQKPNKFLQMRQNRQSHGCKHDLYIKC